MSEPVIKAKAMRCSACNGTPGEWHFVHAGDVVLPPLYTRDDLVRVAVAAAKLAPHVDIEEQCEHLVDRLTKGDV